MTERLAHLEKKVDSIESTLLRLNETIIHLDSKVELQSTKLTGALELQSQRLSAALDLQGQTFSSGLDLQTQKLTSTLENKSISFDGKLKDLKLSIILWVLGLPGLAFALYRIYQSIATHQ
ncbi:hypothetical protein I2492_19550 [Budviciaceae bacterium CWB-B4]|uniref:DUF1640 domain-containing protein n=1 Tax=Limnobaculum xujianqingii TaxID=2738837 RepID=A0A9D7FWK2_9GAMM|nr:hypothetical protein [Limnobaculum xujianqingii]MBK5178503.1 hypothetical protein [Limnobaculum xujianqingii]